MSQPEYNNTTLPDLTITNKRSEPARVSLRRRSATETVSTTSASLSPGETKEIATTDVLSSDSDTQIAVNGDSVGQFSRSQPDGTLFVTVEEEGVQVETHIA